MYQQRWRALQQTERSKSAPEIGTHQAAGLIEQRNIGEVITQGIMEGIGVEKVRRRIRILIGNPFRHGFVARLFPRRKGECRLSLQILGVDDPRGGTVSCMAVHPEDVSSWCQLVSQSRGRRQLELLTDTCPRVFLTLREIYEGRIVRKKEKKFRSEKDENGR